MNKDWTKLKQSANGLPKFDSIIPYILEVLKMMKRQQFILLEIEYINI